MPNSVNWCKQRNNLNIFQNPNFKQKKSGRHFHKNLELLLLEEKNFSRSFLLISMWNIVFKREQIETRWQEGVLEKRGCELHLQMLTPRYLWRITIIVWNVHKKQSFFEHYFDPWKLNIDSFFDSFGYGTADLFIRRAGDAIELLQAQRTNSME